ncbi:MAG: nucleotide exchange factor GrpE [Candidatus Paceibacterota bacterium]|jgi:molecular chaperone GrpE
MSEELKKELQECQKERDEYLAGWQRAKADFINHKREELERMQEIIKFAEEEMILKFLSIVDDFDLAEKHLTDQEKEDEKIKGILQIKRRIRELLKNSSVEEIKALGEKFDPSLHEAVELVESDKEPGIIIEELQKGYLMAGKVVRPSKAKVSK